MKCGQDLPQLKLLGSKPLLLNALAFPLELAVALLKSSSGLELNGCDYQMSEWGEKNVV